MNITDYPHGLLFDEKLQSEIKNRFWHVDSDPEAGKRLFFENAGGSLRLKAVNKAYQEADSFPDCDSRKHPRAKALRKLTLNGFADLRVMFNAPKYGQIIAEKSSSKVMFEMVRTVLENVKGSNVVVTDLDHPSAYDSVMYYGKKAGMEIRVAKPNRVTGGIDVEEIERLVDKDTALLVCIYASNHTGAVMDMKAIVNGARAIKPDLYIISDAVQHIPHGLVDVQDLQLDGINFAAYKIFGCRGFGAAYVSDRLAVLNRPGILGNLGDSWEIGGPAPAMYASVSAIVDHVCWIGSHFIQSTDRRELYTEGMERIEMHERALLYRALEGTEQVPGIRHIPHARVEFDRESLENRDFIMPLTFDNISCPEAVTEYVKRDIIVYDRSDSNYYSVRSLHPFDLEGIVRVSPLHCHSVEDIDTFLKATAEIARL